MRQNMGQEGSSRTSVSRGSAALPSSFLEGLCDHALLDADEEKALAYRGDEASLRRLVECNYRLVAAIARRHTARGCSYEDLFQEGCIGLMRAARGFNPELGWRFSTYATFCICRAIRAALRNHKRGACDEDGLDNTASLEALSENADGSGFEPADPDCDVMSEALERVQRQVWHTRFEGALACISAEHRNLLMLRYDWRRTGALSTADAARRLGIAYGRAHRVERAALEAMRRNLPRSGHGFELEGECD